MPDLLNRNRIARAILIKSPALFMRVVFGKKHLIAKIGIILALIIGPVLMFPDSDFTRYSEYKIGSISPDEVRAPFTFPVYKTPDQLTTERRDAQSLVAPVFDRNSALAKSQLANLDEFINYLDLLRNAPKPFEYKDNDGQTQNYIPPAFDSVKSAIIRKFGFSVMEERWAFLVNKENATIDNNYGQMRSDTLRLLKRATIGRSLTRSQFLELSRDWMRILTDLFALGIIDEDKNNFKSPISPINVREGLKESTEFIKNVNDVDEARYHTQDLLKTYYSDTKLINLSYEVLSRFIIPNILASREETEARKREASANVPQTYGFVLSGDIIVNKNETISSKTHQQLQSLEATWAQRREAEGGVKWLLPFIGRSFLVFSLMFFLLGYIYIYRPDIFSSIRKLSLLVSLILLEITFYYVFIHVLKFPAFVIPIVFSSVLLTTLFDVRIGLIGTISISFLIGAMQGNEYTTTIVLLFVGSVACITVVNFSRRSHIFSSVLWVSGAYIFIIATTSFVKYTEFTEIFLHQLPYAIVSGMSSMLVAFGCLVLFEQVFDVSTTFTLLELSDSNHPLQQQLALKAPGTYHHSVIVANLSHAGAEATGANSLLARVGALYHDIGKIEMPEYFIENQIGGVNKHDRLDPHMSAKILLSHIHTGMELAEKYRLPKIIRSYIPEHHGNLLMTFFYHRAMENKKPDAVISEASFRYPGPRPKTKESGIIMLADGVEAATHAIKEPNAEKIRNVVNEIIERRLKSGELDECELTIGDLKRITEAFIPIILGIYHVRVEYPKADPLPIDGKNVTVGAMS